MSDVGEVAPEIPAWRFAVMAAAACVAYLTLPWWMRDAEPPEPLLLTLALVVGAAAGVVAGRMEADRGRSPRRRPPPSKAEVRTRVAGLAGAALVLAQLLADSAVPWVVLGMVGLTAGGTMHRWMLARTTPSGSAHRDN